MRIFNRRNNNGSSTTEPNALVQSGWTAGQPGVAVSLNMSVTFPVAFTSVPIVTATFGGDTAGVTSTLGSGSTTINNAFAEATNITTTGFTLRVISSTNWAANNTVYGQWIAIGL